MTLKKSISKFLSNKIVFYIVLILAIINIIGYLAMSNFNAIVFFILIGVITHQFSKNITIVLLITLIATSLLVSTKLIKEGMETAEIIPNIDEEEEALPINFKENKNLKGALQQIKQNEKKPVVVSATKPTPSKTDIGVVIPLQNEPFKKGKKDGLRIDYMTTVEEAYSNLDKMLGNDGIKNLSSDTKKLMGQQQNLFKSMESMAPLLGQAQQMLEQFDIKSLTGLSGLSDKLNKKNPII